MGSWSATIMGGDGPLDAQGDILDFIGFNEQDGDRHHSDHLPEVKELFEKLDPSTWNDFFKKGGHHGYSSDKKQVAVVLIMECGATLPADLAQAAIEVSEAEINGGCGNWNDPGERKMYLQQFIDTIGQYDGTPTDLPSEGLFEKLASHLSVKPRLN